jgi:hypothetical protein
MKFLISALFLCSTQAFASGCMPDDVQLVSETTVLDLGAFDASYRCDHSNVGCGISTQKEIPGEYYEYHWLISLSSTPIDPHGIQYQNLGPLNLKLYRQLFVGSCGETYRYVVGVDFKDIRFRETEDLKEL